MAGWPVGPRERLRPRRARVGSGDRGTRDRGAAGHHDVPGPRRPRSRRHARQPRRGGRAMTTERVAAPAVDAVTLEVLRNALYSVSDEMVAGLIRASYSTNIKDRRDASCGIYTAEGDVIAMSEFGGTPLHLGTMHPAVRTVFASWPPETLEPGDAIIMNTPYPAGPGHLNDVCVVGPIFVDGELFGLAASQSHRVDIGGYAPGSMPFGVTEHFQEGLQITPMKIMRRGVLDEHLLAFINQNVRTPEEQTG